MAFLIAVGQGVGEFGQRVDGLAELLAVVGQGPQHGVEVGDDLSDQFVAVGKGVGEGGRLGQHRSEGGSLALQGGDELTAQRVDLVGVQGSEQGSETADEGVEIQCGRGLCERDGGAGRQLAGVAGAVGQARGTVRRSGRRSGSPRELRRSRTTESSVVNDTSTVASSCTVTVVTLPTSTPAIRTKLPSPPKT